MPQASVAVCAWLRAMFDGFALERIDVGEAELRVRHGGAGPPILLLHGHPRTHATWHRVAPVLAGRFTVVCPDLRGYGESSKPETTAGRSTVIRLPFGAAGPRTFAASPSIQGRGGTRRAGPRDRVVSAGWEGSVIAPQKPKRRDRGGQLFG